MEKGKRPEKKKRCPFRSAVYWPVLPPPSPGPGDSYLQADAFGDHVLHQDVGQRLEVVREPVAVGLGAALLLHQHGQQPRVGPAAAGHAGGRLGRDQRAPDYRRQAVAAAATRPVVVVVVGRRRHTGWNVRSPCTPRVQCAETRPCRYRRCVVVVVVVSTSENQSRRRVGGRDAGAERRELTPAVERAGETRTRLLAVRRPPPAYNRY